jgi:hypothetical protein
MPRKKAAPKTEPTVDKKEEATECILDCKQAVADELKLSVHRLDQLLNRYPFGRSGVAGKLNGRWHVLRKHVWRWYKYVQSQELRHPDSRRRRPVEPPDVQMIQGR